MRITIAIAILCLFFSCQKFDRINKIASSELVISNSYVISTSMIIDVASKENVMYGTCWGKALNPTITDDKITHTGKYPVGSFSDTLINIDQGVVYHVRSFIKDANEIIYSEDNQICLENPDVVLSVYGMEILDESSIRIYGSLEGLGSLKFDGYGHCWQKNSTPTVNDISSFYSSSYNGEFITIMQPLTIDKTYSIRTYLKFEDGSVLYSDTLNARIPDLKVRTDSYQILGSGYVKIVGEVTELPVIPVVDHGFCWSITTNTPTVNDSIVSMGSMTITGIYSYNHNIQFPGEKVFFRAYAVKDNKIKYGEVLSFIYN